MIPNYGVAVLEPAIIGEPSPLPPPDPSDPNPPPNPPPSSTGFIGHFETGDLSQWPGVQRATVDRIQVVPSPAAPGSNFAGRFEVKHGDVVAAGRGSGNRAEVYQGGSVDGYPYRDQTEWTFSWSSFLAADYPQDDGWQTITQFNNSGPGGAVIALQVSQGNKLQLRSAEASGSASAIWTGTISFGVWINWWLKIRFSRSRVDGLIEFWRNGVRLLAPTPRITLWADVAVILKQGIYRSSGIVPDQVVYHDGTVVEKL